MDCDKAKESSVDGGGSSNNDDNNNNHDHDNDDASSFYVRIKAYLRNEVQVSRAFAVKKTPSLRQKVSRRSEGERDRFWRKKKRTTD